MLTSDRYEFFSAWEGKLPWDIEVTGVSEVANRYDSMQWGVYSLRCSALTNRLCRIAPTPLLMIVADNDILTHTDLAIEAYSRARESKLHVIPEGHFDGYSGPNVEKTQLSD